MRPRERYTLLGPEQSTDAELLALILGVGAAGKSTLELGQSLLERFGDLPGVSRAPVEALRRVPGVGPARAVRLHAALQAGRRATRGAHRPPELVRTPDQAFEMLRHGLEDRDTEELHALYLDRKGRVSALIMLSRGSEGATVADPTQVFRPAVQCGAQAVILAHNHPSGDLAPSDADLMVTRRLLAAGRLLGIELTDHLIIGRGCYVSLRNEGHLT